MHEINIYSNGAIRVAIAPYHPFATRDCPVVIVEQHAGCEQIAGWLDTLPDGRTVAELLRGVDARTLYGEDRDTLDRLRKTIAAMTSL